MLSANIEGHNVPLVGGPTAESLTAGYLMVEDFTSLVRLKD